MLHQFVRPRDLCHGILSPISNPAHPASRVAVKSRAADTFAALGKSSLPSKNRRMFLNTIDQKGIFGGVVGP
jgi:hypothetical protein